MKYVLCLGALLFSGFATAAANPIVEFDWSKLYHLSLPATDNAGRPVAYTCVEDSNLDHIYDHTNAALVLNNDGNLELVGTNSGGRQMSFEGDVTVQFDRVIHGTQEFVTYVDRNCDELQLDFFHGRNSCTEDFKGARNYLRLLKKDADAVLFSLVHTNMNSRSNPLSRSAVRSEYLVCISRTKYETMRPAQATLGAGERELTQRFPEILKRHK